MREAWTDERLDDMSQRMESGFNRVETDIRDLRREVRGQGDSLRGEIGSVRDELNGRVDGLRGEMNDRFDAMQRLIIQVGGGMFATMVVGFISVIVALG